MSRNGSGTYSLPAGNPVVTNEVISSTWANTTLSDIASALTDSLSRTGLGGMTNPLQLPNGLIGAPALTFSSETTLGFYRAGAGDVRLAAGGVDIFSFLTAVTTSANNAFTGNNSFSGSTSFTKTFVSGAAGPVVLSSAQPVFELDQSGAAANQRRWWMTATGEELLLQAANDARTSATTFLQVTRTNNTADAINFTATAVGLGAATLSGSGTATWTGKHIFSSVFSATNPQVMISAATPMLQFNQTGAAANNRLWRIYASSERMIFEAENDADNAGGEWLTVDRTGTTVDRVNFPTTTGLSFVIGSAFTTPSSGGQLLQVNSGGTVCAAAFKNNSNIIPVMCIGSGQTGGNTYIQFYDGDDPDSSTGSISTNGTTTTYGTSSDARLKRNVRTAPPALPVLRNIPVESFDWVKNGLKVDHGFVAQNLNAYVPYAVVQGRVWQVDVAKLIPLMIKAMQEIDTRLTAAGL
jgi:hypothetical protein